MSSSEAKYFSRIAAAFVRGRLGSGDAIAQEDSKLFDCHLDELSELDVEHLLDVGRTRDLKIHKFKRTMGLARVDAVLGILRGLQPASLLDIGTGRGAFLWPLLNSFTDLEITCVDQNPIRVRDILAVRNGGIARVNAVECDVAKLDLPGKSFDVVTFLEALEHIPDPQSALNNAVSFARRAVIVSVPSHEDDNEEHIHLFTRDGLVAMFEKSGVKRVNTRHVLNHMIMIGTI